jgi:hypothetical protein
VGDLLLPEIQDAIPAAFHGSSMGYPQWTGGEIQDAIILDMLVGYLMRYDRRYLSRSCPGIFRKSGTMHLPAP